MVRASPKSGAESKAITISWTNAPPVPCANGSGDNWDGTNKLMLRREAGSTAASSPSSGSLVANMLPSVKTRDDFMHRSDRTYAYALFPCEDSTCSSWYADGSGSLEAVAIDDQNANAPHIFFYPSDWGSTLSDKLGMYYSKADLGGSPSEIYYVIHDDTGWPSSNPLNATASWSSPVLFAEGSTDSADDDYNADHSWAMLTRDGSDKRIQLFVQSQDLTKNKIIQIESVDDVGDDFGLCCGATSCSTTILDGRGYVAVETDGGSADRPVVHIDDRHDNTMLPLPGGEFKLYYKDWSSQDWYVTYWDGSDWVDDALIEFYWDGSASGPSNDCIENPAALVHNEGAGGLNAAMAFMLLYSAICPLTGTGLDDDAGANPGDDTAILFAKYAN